MSRDNTWIHTESRPSEASQGPAAVVDALLECAAHLTARYSPRAVGIAVPCVVDEASGMVVYAGSCAGATSRSRCGSPKNSGPVPGWSTTATSPSCPKRGKNSPAVECDGTWTVAGHSYPGSLPLRTARPGDRVAILVRNDEPTQVFGAQTLQNAVVGTVFGLLGLTLGLTAAAALLRRRRWLSSRLRDAIASEQQPPAVF
ncbi:hypothetical protein [Streptacidiphilus sp. EB103A]|uniref:hypothetical protein n=1 Tax=Streptacidiphilus sp. EB103A TaxID=3156275 RepID=UPI0035140E96